ncbi:MAG TPA: alpha-1,2-fucosyltransferase [Chitinophagaceae bacterium]
MIIVQLTGGLGNQLFQYAAAKSLSLHHNVSLQLDITSFYRDKLPDLEVPRDFELYQFEGIREKIISLNEIGSVIDLKNEKSFFQKIRPRYKRNIYTEPFYHFDKNFFNSNKNVLLKGGWQSEKYFDPYKDLIRQRLQLKETVITQVIEKGRSLTEKQTVGVHIRRGDYLRKKIIFEWHGVMSKEYYLKGFELLSKRIPGFSVLYFTDDPDWVQKELLPIMNGEIVSKETSQTHFEDFYLLSKCRHTIIANSSFSWWAAWLNNNPDKIIIAPKKWFDKGPKDTKDIIPLNWFQI